jgi:hypothetical protein
MSHRDPAVPFIYNMTGGIDEVTSCVLLHVTIWFDFELVNLLFLSYIPRPMARNSTSTLPLSNPAGT